MSRKKTVHSCGLQPSRSALLQAPERYYLNPLTSGCVLGQRCQDKSRSARGEADNTERPSTSEEESVNLRKQEHVCEASGAACMYSVFTACLLRRPYLYGHSDHRAVSEELPTQTVQLNNHSYSRATNYELLNMDPLKCKKNKKRSRYKPQGIRTSCKLTSIKGQRSEGFFFLFNSIISQGGTVKVWMTVLLCGRDSRFCRARTQNRH